MADWVYVCDFDHRMDDINLPIKDQGIVKGPVRIGPDTWIATKVTVLRNTTIGRGCVLGAHAVVKGDIPDYSIAVGAPAKVVKNRKVAWEHVGGRARQAGRRAGRHRAQESRPRPSACVRQRSRQVRARRSSAADVVARSPRLAARYTCAVSPRDGVPVEVRGQPVPGGDRALAAPRPGSSSTARTAAARPATSPGGNDIPVSPSITASPSPPTVDVTSGVPAAAASSATMPNGS